VPSAYIPVSTGVFFQKVGKHEYSPVAMPESIGIIEGFEIIKIEIYKNIISRISHEARLYISVDGLIAR
jgi:hypothetical protein